MSEKRVCRNRRAVLLLRVRGLPDDRRRTVVGGAADLPAGLYDAARAAVVGHPRLGRDQPAERTRMVAALRIHRQYPLCPRHPALPEIRAGAVRGRGRGADAGPHAESRPVRPAGNPDAPLGTGIFVNVAIFLLAVGLAWACLKLYDLPVREWLKRHWLMK